MRLSQSDSGEDWNPYTPPASSRGFPPSPGLLPTQTWLVAISVFIKVALLILLLPVIIILLLFFAAAVVWLVTSLMALSPLGQKIIGYALLFYLVLRFSLGASNRGRIPVRELALGVVAGLLIYWL